jgi:hypothetical protein
MNYKETAAMITAQFARPVNLQDAYFLGGDPKDYEITFKPSVPRLYLFHTERGTLDDVARQDGWSHLRDFRTTLVGADNLGHDFELYRMPDGRFAVLSVEQMKSGGNYYGRYNKFVLPPMKDGGEILLAAIDEALTTQMGGLYLEEEGQDNALFDLVDELALVVGYRLRGLTAERLYIIDGEEAVYYTLAAAKARVRKLAEQAGVEVKVDDTARGGEYATRRLYFVHASTGLWATIEEHATYQI